VAIPDCALIHVQTGVYKERHFKAVKSYTFYYLSCSSYMDKLNTSTPKRHTQRYVLMDNTYYYFNSNYRLYLGQQSQLSENICFTDPVPDSEND